LLEIAIKAEYNRHPEQSAQATDANREQVIWDKNLPLPIPNLPFVGVEA